MIIKQAKKEHAGTLAEFRYRMFDEMYPDDNLSERKAEIVEKSTQYFLSHIDDSDHYSIIAYADWIYHVFHYMPQR
ncbi:MAG: hypothetical protein JW822_08400 [Spirochaetales bacterium]|nr:hypothetical protein [Spirochaetales bacterium]